MVRRPAALLAVALGAALAYFLLAPSLPGPSGTGTANTIASDVPALLLLGACALALLPAYDSPVSLALVAAGAGLLGAALTEAGTIPGANVSKVLFAAALGMFLAWALADPAVVIAVPLFVAAVDIASVAGGPSGLLAREEPRSSDFLSFYLPGLHVGGRAGVIGVADLIFLGFFAASAWRFGFRRLPTALALLAALPVALALEVTTDRTIPALPILSAALLLPNLDLLPGLLRRRGAAA